MWIAARYDCVFWSSVRRVGLPAVVHSSRLTSLPAVSWRLPSEPTGMIGSRRVLAPATSKAGQVSALANHRPGGVGEQPGVTFAPGKIAAIMSGLLTAIAIALRTSGSHSPFPRALVGSLLRSRCSYSQAGTSVAAPTEGSVVRSEEHTS